MWKPDRTQPFERMSSSEPHRNDQIDRWGVPADGIDLRDLRGKLARQAHGPHAGRGPMRSTRAPRDSPRREDSRDPETRGPRA